MDAQARGQLLRERLKAIREAPVSLARKGWMGFPNSYNPHGAMTKAVQVKWVSEPVPVPDVAIKPKRTAKESPLMRIARQYPVRLSRSEPSRKQPPR